MNKQELNAQVDVRKRARGQRSRRDFLKLGATGLVGASILAACGPAAGPAPEEATVTGPKAGGQIVLSILHPQTLNPALLPVSTTIYTTPLFFNALTRPDDDMVPSPDLAESWDISSDSLTYTFHLRKGVKFQDGEPFTSADVKFTWETICHPDNATGRQICGFFSRVKGASAYTAGEAAEIEGITILDDYTIQVELEEVYAPFLSISAGQMIIPKHIWQDVPVAEMWGHPASRKPIGTGPFVVDSWTTNETIVAHAFEDYYEGRPWLDRIILRFIATGTADVFGLLRAGEVNALGLYGALPIDNLEEAQNDPLVSVRPLQGFYNYYVEFNLANPLFQDVRVRQALSYAVDRQSLVDGLLLGQGTIHNSPVHPAFKWAVNPDTPLYNNDPEEAKRLLEEAGWTPGEDGILEKDGQRLSFTISTIQPNYPVLLQEQWRRIGVEAEIELMDFGSFWGPIYLAHKHEVAALNLPYGLYLDPDYPLGGYFHSSLNRNSYSNERGDELIRLATATLDQEKRAEYYYEFQQLIAEDVPHLWMGIPNEVWAFSQGLLIPEKPTGYLTIRSIKDWYWAE